MNAALLLLLLAAQDRTEETCAVVLHFKSMHCAECQKGVEDGLKALAGVKKVTVDAANNRATLAVLEKSTLRYSALRKAVPSDLKIETCEVTIRGTAEIEGDRIRLVAKGSKQHLYLRNHKKEGEPEKDRVGELKAAMAAGQATFKVTGTLEETKKETFVAVTSFEKTEWKE